MKRIDGFLCIDECEKIVADKDKGHYWVYIDGVEYYFKPACFESGIFCSELIAYQAANFLGIDACFYDLAILDGEEGYISKSLCNNAIKLIPGEVILGEYLVGSKMVNGNMVRNIDIIRNMGIDSCEADMIEEECKYENNGYFSSDYINTLEIIWQALEDRYGDKINTKELMHQFVLMYIFTILFKDVDNHPGNWMIMESKESIRLAPLFDNELIFNDQYDDVNFSINFKDFNSNIYNSLRVFFEVSGIEYFDLFMNMFDLIISNFGVILELVEKQIGVKFSFDDKEYILDMFYQNVDGIKNVIDEFKDKYYKIRSRKISTFNK